MLTIKMPAADAVTIASLIHLTDAKTPRLDVIHLSTLAGETMAIASDRFALGQTYSQASATGEALWAITTEAAKFITANVKPLNKWHTPAPVVFEINPEERTGTIRAGNAVFGYEWPAVELKSNTIEQLTRVLDNWRARTDAPPVTLGTRLLMKLSKVLDGFSKSEKWSLELGASNSTREERPGPLRATNGRVTILIQPRLDPVA
jgi:hypothetical protein